MKNKISILALIIILAIPFRLLAEEMEIQLMEVIEMVSIPGDSPQDGPAQDPANPTRPTNFCATIDGSILTVNKLEVSIPYAQALVVDATNGNIIVNQSFTSSISRQITHAGIYILHIQTVGGSLWGQFVVQ